MAQPKLTFYVDIISPFAYMAFYVLTHDATFKGVDIEYIPVFLGGIMQETNNRPPLSIKNKAEYVGRQQQRWLKRFSIPVADRNPSPFPQSTITAGRALCTIQQKYPAKLVDAIGALYKIFFVELKQISKPETVAEALATVLSKQEVEDVMSAVQQPEIKQRLLDNTKAALEQGAFGLPYFIAANAKGEKDYFWGFDHLSHIIEHMQLEQRGDKFRAAL